MCHLVSFCCCLFCHRCQSLLPLCGYQCKRIRCSHLPLLSQTLSDYIQTRKESSQVTQRNSHCSLYGSLFLSAFATNKDIRCHFGSSTTSKSDISSYRYSEGSSLFRRSVLHRIRFGNTLRLKAEFPNSAASSLRTNDLLGSDRRPSSSLSAYPDQWMFHHQHRRLSGSPQAPLPAFVTDDLHYRTRIMSQKTLDNIPAALAIDLPNASTTSLAPPDSQTDLDNHEKNSLAPQTSLTHLPECIYANSNATKTNGKTDTKKSRRISSREKSKNNGDASLSMKIADIESESSSAWTTEGLPFTPIATAAMDHQPSGPPCSCQLLWQLERDTDSIDRFKLFFKRDHLNVDWDYVQGSSDV